MDYTNALNRLSLLKNQITQSMTLGGIVRSSPRPKSDDDVVLVAMSRTALCKAGRGSFKDTAPEVLLAHVLKDVCEKAGLDPSKVDDIAAGNTLQPGAGATTSRMATFLAGFPAHTSLQAVNRMCSSGLQCVSHIANAIRAGQIDIGIGCGVESMTHFSFNDSLKPDVLSDDIFEMENARNCLMSMGVTSDNVAKEFGITREE